jgi:hypothetical protein
VFLLAFFLHVRARERAGKEPLLSPRAVPQPHLEPGARDAEHPVAAAHGADRHRPRRHADPVGQRRAAIAGTILVSDLASGNDSYVLAMIVLAALALIGLTAALRLPHGTAPTGTPAGLTAAPVAAPK